MTVNSIVLYFFLPPAVYLQFFVYKLHAGLGGPKFNFLLWVLTIKKRLILGTIIAYGMAVASTIVTIPNVAIELNADIQTQTIEIQETGLIDKNNQTKTQKTVEMEVRKYFKDIPILAEVARCESHFTHINPATGNVIRGKINPNDVGVMQINEHYHNKTAEKMGLDLKNFDDNMAYARYLYKREGTRPWKASSACWFGHLAMK